MKKLFFISLILMNNIAFAEKTNSQFDVCMDKAGGVTVNMLNCIDAETQRQDKKLNTMYQNVMKSLTDKRKEQLKKAQQIWIKYRDANCGFYHDPEGGTIASISGANCVMDMTTQRAKELEDFHKLTKDAG
ncbi:MAG: hypothetical protein RIT27_2315 [Pseudomonadota bacterium]|jgi:uncharacterized protein YecT (DUF1311 family)